MTKKETKETSPKIYWEMEVRDKSGKLIKSARVDARSWLRQFITMLKGEFASRYGAAVGGNNTSVVDEGGTARAYPWHVVTFDYAYQMNLSTLADTGDVTQGIIVGSETTANDLNTYKLATKILHGTSAGKLVYNPESIEEVTNPSGLDLQFRITRTFTNNTGATVTVAEIGLLIRKDYANVTGASFLAARDVLGTAVDVPDGATLTIRYVVKITIA